MRLLKHNIDIKSHVFLIIIFLDKKHFAEIDFSFAI